jgi:replicative DNA helicase
MREKIAEIIQKGTMLLMYDGTIKAVEDIEVGDLLMGDDSRSRKVRSTTNQILALFKDSELKWYNAGWDDAMKVRENK